MDISFHDVSFNDIFQVMISPFANLFSLGIYFHLVLFLESLEHAYLLHVFYFACFLSLTQYIGETPPSLKLDEMCMKFIFISICTYLCGVCPMYCWFSNSLVPMSLGTILFVCCSRNNWRCIGCSAHLQGRCWHRVLNGAKLGWSTNNHILHQSNDVLVTSIYFMHTFLARPEHVFSWLSGTTVGSHGTTAGDVLPLHSCSSSTDTVLSHPARQYFSAAAGRTVLPPSERE